MVAQRQLDGYRVERLDALNTASSTSPCQRRVSAILCWLPPHPEPDESHISHQEFVCGPSALLLQFVILFYHGEARPCISRRGTSTKDHEIGEQDNVDCLNSYWTVAKLLTFLY